ncbi:hypothetical protein [Kribbella shirazensis]|uniref:Uncharacterized protein with PQ loop repeat n=1 Tax=Kribbella shirazensis TaxID=1105143 RepID=A0A7X6A3U5_9ACTN|nr:hypothetical protein [Kribbella shirazensis]NIK60797.1 uncharacterized protein with PQ loop repeat [Kribbella shirazensis]
MTGVSVALLAGTMSTILVASSALPMVVKAIRTRDLASYSPANLVLANVGNAVHCIYVVHLPPGPIWILHGFYVVTSALMLLWWLRFHPLRRGVERRPA